MNLVNSGTLTTKTELTEDQQIELNGILKSHSLRGIVTATGVAINNLKGDIQDKLEEFIAESVENGITLSGRIDYTGDYDGYLEVLSAKDPACDRYVISHEKEAEKVTIDDKELVALARERGYEVILGNTKNEEMKRYIGSEGLSVEAYWFYTRCRLGGLNPVEADNYARLNTLCQYDVGLKNSRNIANWLRDNMQEDLATFNSTTECRDLADHAARKLNVYLNTSNWMRKDPDAFVYYEEAVF